MPHRPKGSQWFKTRITLADGTTGLFACGTTDREVANDVERFVKNLHHKREWAPLRAVVEKRTKLALLHDHAQAGQLDSFLSALASPDLSPLVAEWPARSAKYRRQVRMLIKEGQIFRSSEFTAVRVAGFLDGLKASGATKNRYYAALSAFGKWLKRRGIIATNVVRDVERAKATDPTPRWLDRKQAKALIAALPMPNRAIEALMASFGAEWQVCERGTKADVDLRHRTFHAHGGKNQWRDRIARPTELWAWRIFAAYAKTLPDGARLFPRVREDTALRVHKAVGKTLGIPRTTLHDWRHSYAVQARRDGYTDTIIAHNLGHKDTTLIAKRYGRHTPRPEDFVRRHAKRPPSRLKARRRARPRNA